MDEQLSCEDLFLVTIKGVVKRVGQLTRFRRDVHRSPRWLPGLLITPAARPRASCGPRRAISSEQSLLRPLLHRMFEPICAPRSQARAVRPAMGKKRSAAQLEVLKAATAARHDGASSPTISEPLNESPALVARSAAALTSPQVTAYPFRSVGGSAQSGWAV